MVFQNFDPCLLPIAEEATAQSQSRTTRRDRPFSERPLNLQMIPLPVINPRAPRYRKAPENHRSFLLLRILHHDKSVSEHLYLESALKMRSMDPPDAQSFAGLTKSPAKVEEDFILPDGVIDDFDIADSIDPDASDPFSRAEVPKQPKLTSTSIPNFVDQSDTRTMEMGWLIKAINQERDSSSSQAFETCLESISAAIARKSDTIKSGAETLTELSEAEPLVTDIDIAAAELSALVERILSRL